MRLRQAQTDLVAGNHAAINEVLQTLTQDIADFDLSTHVPVLTSPPSALEFARDYVGRNRPCVVRGTLGHWRALETWSLDFLCERMGSKEVAVTFTPDGKADSVKAATSQQCFALPDTQNMTLRDFQNSLITTRINRSPCVPSVQFQNSNLTSQFKELEDDIELCIPWATEAFGCQPDAVNLWIGDKRYSTSFHKVRMMKYILR